MTRFTFRKIDWHVGALIVVLLWQPAVSGQNPDRDRERSHGPIPGGGLANQTQLQERLRRARVASDFQDLIRQSGIDSRFLEELQQNPERQKEIEALLRAVLKDHQALPPFLDGDDPRARQLDGLIRDWSGKGDTPPPGFDPGLWKQLAETAKSKTHPPPLTTPGMPSPMNPATDSTRPPQTNGPTSNNGQPSAAESTVNGANPFAPAQRTGFEEKVMQWAQQFIERNPSFRDSNVMRSVITELDRLRLHEALHTNNGRSFGTQIAQNMEKLLPSRQFLDDTLRPMLNRLPRPDLPNIRLPSVDLPRPILPSLDLSASSLGTPSAGTLGMGVLFTLTVAALFFLGRRLYRMRGSESLSANGRSRPKSPTIRFDPHMPIHTRNDLIRAFEQLSVHSLGVQAENWNHRAIAEHLGGYSVSRRRAAGILAQFYELARYAPEAESMTPESFGIAQREIKFLAGAPSA